MNQFNALLKILNDELQGQRDLLKLLTHEKTLIVSIKQDEIDELQAKKSSLLEELQRLSTAREAIVRSVLQVEDGKKPVKATEAILKCSDLKLKKQLQTAATALKSISVQVKELNTYNSKLVNQALGILTSSLAIVRSTPGTELPTYGGKGKLNSKSADPAFQKRKSLVTTA